MSQNELIKIIDTLKREIFLLKTKIKKIEERHYKEDIDK